MHGDPYFSFPEQILYTIISTLSKNEQKINVGKNSSFLPSGRKILPSCRCKAQEIMVAKCEQLT